MTPMDLILWRHAEAEDAHPGLDDLDRGLTQTGWNQARRMAAWLDKRLPQQTRLLTSPALRARQTASVLKRNPTVLPSIPPGTSPENLLQAIGWPAAKGTVVLVGHQPELGMLAGLLLTGQPMPWSVRKGSIWWLHGRQRQGSIQIVLRAALSTDDL